MAAKKYRDRFAEVRQINVHNRSVCYWRNNLTVSDLKKQGGWLVLEESGSYNGLTASVKVRVREEFLDKVFKTKKGQVELWGSPEHMGVMVRMKEDLFPRKCCGSTESVEYEFEMGGTIRGLSYVNEEAVKKGKCHRKKKERRRMEI